MQTLFLKRLASRMPISWQLEMKRHFYRRQILHDRFLTDEPEYALLDSLLSRGDWAIDVGANVGHYTKRMSDLVSDVGHVIAFEPVPDVFSLLTANARNYRYQNLTLLNAAASDRPGLVGISIPSFETGLPNYYEAQISPGAKGLQTMTLAIDSLRLPQPIRLVKIDAEGHEAKVLRGMKQLLGRDKPILIIEVSTPEVDRFLEPFGYAKEILPDSPNQIYRT